MNKIFFSLMLCINTFSYAMNNDIPEAWSITIVVNDTLRPAYQIFTQCKQVYDAPENSWGRSRKPPTHIDGYLNERDNLLRIEIFDKRETIIQKLKNMPWFSEKKLYQFGSSPGI
jgi:hypothetical protein